MLPVDVVAFMARFGMGPDDVKTVETMLRSTIVGMMQDALKGANVVTSSRQRRHEKTAQRDDTASQPATAAERAKARRDRIALLRAKLENHGIKTTARQAIGELTALCDKAGIDVEPVDVVTASSRCRHAKPNERDDVSGHVVTARDDIQAQSAENRQSVRDDMGGKNAPASRARESALDSKNITNHSSTSHRYRDDKRDDIADPRGEPKANPRFIAFCHRAGMNRFPSDLGRMIEEWERAGFDFDLDVLPVVARVANELSRAGKPPAYKARFFDDSIRRAKAEEDAQAAAATRARERAQATVIESAERFALDAFDSAEYLVDCEDQPKDDWPESRIVKDAKMAADAMRDLSRAIELGIDLRALAQRERRQLIGVEWFERQLAAQLETAK